MKAPRCDGVWMDWLICVAEKMKRNKEYVVAPSPVMKITPFRYGRDAGLGQTIYRQSVLLLLRLLSEAIKSAGVAELSMSYVMAYFLLQKPRRNLGSSGH
jgi:hypothetical protein